MDELDQVAVSFMAMGLTHWVADGGDGTLHALIQAWRRAAGGHGGQRPVVFMPTAGGTIDFMAKRSGVAGRPLATMMRLAEVLRTGGTPREVDFDTLEITGWDARGVRRWQRIGFACALAGVAERFFDEYYDHPRPGRRTMLAVVGRTTCGWAAQWVPANWRQRAFLGPFLGRCEAQNGRLFAPVQASVHVDAQPCPGQLFSVLNVGACDINLGGIFKVFPLARELGALHVQVGALAPREVLMNLPRMISGRLLSGPHFEERVAHHLRVDGNSGNSIRPVVDGERLDPVMSVEVALGPRLRFANLSSKGS